MFFGGKYAIKMKSCSSQHFGERIYYSTLFIKIVSTVYNFIFGTKDGIPATLQSRCTDAMFTRGFRSWGVFFFLG